MAIEKKLIHFSKLSDFETQLNAGNILDYSIVFIQDAKKIWTHGQYYDCNGGNSVDLSEYLTADEIAEIYATIESLNGKQDTLVSGANIKTINDQSLLGSGNINVCQNPDWNAESGSNSYIAGKTHYVTPIYTAIPNQKIDLLINDDISKDDYRIFFEGELYKLPELVGDILCLPNESNWKIKVLYLSKSETSQICSLQHHGVNSEVTVANSNLYVVQKDDVKTLDPYYLSDSYVSKSGDSISGPLTLDGMDRNINGCINFSPTNSLVVKSLDIHNPILFMMLKGSSEMISTKIGPLTNIVYYETNHLLSATSIVVTFTHKDERISRTLESATTIEYLVDLLTSTFIDVSNTTTLEEIKNFAGGLTAEYYNGYINIINNSNIESTKLEISYDNTIATSWEVYDQMFNIDFENLDNDYSLLMGHPFLPLQFTQYTVNHLSAENRSVAWDSKFIAQIFTERMISNLTNRPVNGKVYGLFSISPSSDTVDIQGTITTAKNLETAPTLTAIGNTLFLNIGKHTSSIDMHWGSAYSEVSHGTADTTFTLTPNTFHIWDEVSSLTLTLGAETSGVANEYLFQFTSGSTATTLSLPDDIKWVGGETPTIEANKIYQISILKGLGSVLEWDSVSLIENKLTLTDGDMTSGSTLTFAYPTASELTLTMQYYSSDTLIVPIGTTSITIDWFEPTAPQIIGINPISDSTYKYIM